MGQPQAVRVIKKSLERGSIAHAYLFAGVEGVGKTLCAVSLVQALNCEGQDRGECGSCPVCQKIRNFSFPDFRKIEPGGVSRIISIDEIRELRREIYLRPVEGNYKAFLIICADRMREEAANALLKVLEEPPENSVLILTTSRPDILLPTIVSRCQRINFRRLGCEDIIKILRLRQDVPEERAGIVADLSAGSPGRALSLLEWGLEERDSTIAWINECSSDVESIFSKAAEMAKNRQKLLLFLEIILSWCRDLFMVMFENVPLINKDHAGELKIMASCICREELEKVLGIIIQAQRWVELNANPRLVLEVVLLNMRGMMNETGSSG